jgi:MFS family permease
MIQIGFYRQVMALRSFRLFWTGFTLSVLGDSMSRVALTWFVYELTDSDQALALLSLTYTGPVLLGGFAAGWLLDRFDRRQVLMLDNFVRGAVFALIPLLYALGTLELWHIYAVSTVYGSLMMISLAGTPSLIPDLVEPSQLATANALETLSYTLSATVGPLLAGFLIPWLGAANVVLLDAVSYFLFALLLLRIPAAFKTTDSQQTATSSSLLDAVRLLTRNSILASTTLMYMCINLGFGAFLVFLPIVADRVLGGGSELYGILLGALSLGELFSSSLVGALEIEMPLGRLICLAQIGSGLALGGMLLSLTVPGSLVSLFLFGFFSAPLTIWAQTLRMQIIPVALRGRTFALLRTLMQAAFPLGGTAAGFLLTSATIAPLIAVSAAIIGLPGVLGTRVQSLWSSSPKT